MKKYIVSIFGTKMEILIGIILLIGFLLPHTNTLFLSVNPLICILLFLITSKKKFQKIIFLPILSILIAIIFNIEGNASIKSLFASANIVICLLTFPFVNNVIIRNFYIYLCFGVIFISQIGYIYHWGPVTSLVDTYYPITWGEHFITHTNENIDIDNYLSFRLGGLYRNPNQCAKYVTMLLAIYFVNNLKSSLKTQLGLAFIACYSVLLTGSRTGFIIASALVLFTIYRKRVSPAFIVLTALIFFLLVGYLSEVSLRGIDIESGLQNSAGLKFSMTMNYLSTESSLLRLLFGNLDMSLFDSGQSYSLDCDYGYIIYCYGFVGLLSFFYFLIKVFKNTPKDKRRFFFILLWMITSSIFMAYRTIFVFMLLSSTIFANYRGNALKQQMNS
jgi:hypothetical protein